MQVLSAPSPLPILTDQVKIGFGNMDRKDKVRHFTKDRCIPGRSIRRKGNNGGFRIWVCHIPRIDLSLMACPALCPGLSSPELPASTRLQPQSCLLVIKIHIDFFPSALLRPSVSKQLILTLNHALQLLQIDENRLTVIKIQSNESWRSIISGQKEMPQDSLENNPAINYFCVDTKLETKASLQKVKFEVTQP